MSTDKDKEQKEDEKKTSVQTNTQTSGNGLLNLGTYSSDYGSAVRAKSRDLRHLGYNKFARRYLARKSYFDETMNKLNSGSFRTDLNATEPVSYDTGLDLLMKNSKRFKRDFLRFSTPLQRNALIANRLGVSQQPTSLNTGSQYMTSSGYQINLGDRYLDELIGGFMRKANPQSELAIKIPDKDGNRVLDLADLTAGVDSIAGGKLISPYMTKSDDLFHPEVLYAIGKGFGANEKDLAKYKPFYWNGINSNDDIVELLNANTDWSNPNNKNILRAYLNFGDDFDYLYDEILRDKVLQSQPQFQFNFSGMDALRDYFKKNGLKHFKKSHGTGQWTYIPWLEVYTEGKKKGGKLIRKGQGGLTARQDSINFVKKKAAEAERLAEEQRRAAAAAEEVYIPVTPSPAPQETTVDLSKLGNDSIPVDTTPPKSNINPNALVAMGESPVGGNTGSIDTDVFPLILKVITGALPASALTAALVKGKNAMQQRNAKAALDRAIYFMPDDKKELIKFYLAKQYPWYKANRSRINEIKDMTARANSGKPVFTDDQFATIAEKLESTPKQSLQSSKSGRLRAAYKGLVRSNEQLKTDYDETVKWKEWFKNEYNASLDEIDRLRQQVRDLQSQAAEPAPVILGTPVEEAPTIVIGEATPEKPVVALPAEEDEGIPVKSTNIFTRMREKAQKAVQAARDRTASIYATGALKFKGIIGKRYSTPETKKLQGKNNKSKRKQLRRR